MVGVDDVVEVSPVLVPEALLERKASADERRLEPVRDRASDPQRVQPQGLHLDRFADPWRDHPVPNLRVHPGQLRARHAGRQKAVVVETDAVARATGVAGHDGLDGAGQGLAGGRRHGPFRSPAGFEEIVHRDHVPQRGVDGVELGRVAPIGKALPEPGMQITSTFVSQLSVALTA